MTNNKPILPRGRIFTGTVTSTKAQKTATVEWERRKLITKYERYERRKSKIKAHVPDAIQIQTGDLVKIQECRPISKTKRFIVIEKIGQSKQKITETQPESNSARHSKTSSNRESKNKTAKKADEEKEQIWNQ